MNAPMAVTIFHPTKDLAGFRDWAEELRASAPAATDFLVSMLGQPHLDWGVGVCFADEDELDRWLDSGQRDRVVKDGERRGILRATAELVISAEGEVPPGVGMFRHGVAAGREGDYVAAQTRLAAAGSKFPGFVGCCLFTSAGRDAESLSLLRFRTEHHLVKWLSSDERMNALESLRASLSGDFQMVSATTSFGMTVRTKNGRVVVTPQWKTAMLILFVLYPTVMLLSRFFGPILDHVGAPPWLGMWLSQVISVAALQWALMPWVGRWFRKWLDPIDGRGMRVSLVGAGALLVGYLVTLVVFATVHELQYWDYGPE